MKQPFGMSSTTPPLPATRFRTTLVCLNPPEQTREKCTSCKKCIPCKKSISQQNRAFSCKRCTFLQTNTLFCRPMAGNHGKNCRRASRLKNQERQPTSQDNNQCLFSSDLPCCKPIAKRRENKDSLNMKSLIQELSGDPNPQYFLKSTAVQMGGVLP